MKINYHRVNLLKSKLKKKAFVGEAVRNQAFKESFLIKFYYKNHDKNDNLLYRSISKCQRNSELDSLKFFLFISLYKKFYYLKSQNFVE